MDRAGVRTTLLLAALCVVGLLSWPWGGGAWPRLAERPLPHAPVEPPAADATIAAPIDVGELREHLQRFAAARFRTGVAVAVVQDGELVLAEGFGAADVHGHTPMTRDTVFRVGSLSKGMLSLALVDLEAKGALRLDDPVRRYLPEVRIDNPWGDTDPVRITHLLEHTSGFDEMHFNEIIADDDETELPMRDVLAINPRSRRVRWRPGTRHAYSHPGYTVAGAVIEAVTGQPYDAHVEATVLHPLGLETASFRHTPRIAERLAPAYQPNLRPLPHRHLHHRPGSSLYVSVGELGRYVEMLANRGVVDGRRVVPESYIDRVENGSTLPYPGLSPSYGLGTYSQQLDRVRSQGHGGWMPGYHSSLRYFPEIRGGFVVLTNEPIEPAAMWVVESRIRQLLLRDVPRAPVPPPHVVAPDELERFTGTYRLRNPEVSFMEAFMPNPTRKVYRLGDGLALRGWGVRGREIIATGPSTFRYPGQAHGSIRFTTSPEGTPILVDANGFGYYERRSTLASIAVDACFVLASIVLFSALFTPILWLPALLLRRPVESLGLRVLPSLGAWALWLMVRLLFGARIDQLGDINGRTALIFVLSWGVGLLAVASLIAAIRSTRRRETSDSSLVIRVYALMASAALCVWAAQLARHGLIGLRTWVW